MTQDTFFENLPCHVAIVDCRPRIQGKRCNGFRGLRYSMGVSKLSNACKVFYTLIVKKGSFEKPLEVEEIPDEDLNKVWLPMDTMETETVSFGEKLTKTKLRLSHNLGPNLRIKYPI